MQIIAGPGPSAPPGLGTAGKGADPAGGLLVLPANASIRIQEIPQQRIDRSPFMKRPRRAFFSDSSSTVIVRFPITKTPVLHEISVTVID